LLEDVGITAIVIAAKITRCGLPAEIAVDTLVIDVVFAGKVFGIAICDVSHNIFWEGEAYPGLGGAQQFFSSRLRSLVAAPLQLARGEDPPLGFDFAEASALLEDTHKLSPSPRNTMTWATRITILRLILVPVFVTLIITYDDSDPRDEIWRYAAIAVFVIASVSDALDGYLARHCNQRSALGALLDPIADKLLLLASLVTLGLIPLDHLRPFPLWFPAIIISRDALLLGGYGVLRHFLVPVEIKPHWTGKLSTFFTLLAIGAVLFKLRVYATLSFCALGAGLALVCTVIYVRQGLDLLSHSGHTKAQSVVEK
jgi:CDP-diacylglycerol--glycerol-3-phosphate 3-phosphatidyltransferase/cardiolipin synthase